MKDNCCFVRSHNGLWRTKVFERKLRLLRLLIIVLIIRSKDRVSNHVVSCWTLWTMDVTQNDNIIDVEKEPCEDIPDVIVCIYPEHETNAVTVSLNDYGTLEDICI